MPDVPDVFLSSAFRNFKEARNRIIAIDKRRIRAVEKDRPDLDQRKGACPIRGVPQARSKGSYRISAYCGLGRGSGVFGQLARLASHRDREGRIG